MSQLFNYTKNVNWLISRFPVLSYVFTQVIFWIIAYFFLAVITYLILLTAGTIFHPLVNFRAIMMTALFFGLSNGIASGLTDQLFERRFFYDRSLAIIIIGKALMSFIVFVVLISFVRAAANRYVQESFIEAGSIAEMQKTWEHFFQLLLLFNIITGFIISFINQVNKKYGPGILIPLMMGKYRKPKEEDRIFLFMDLKSSTSIAEALGHLKYSAFIRDSFLDINSVLSTYNAQIYQYVGDEIVITWPIWKGLLPLYCIQFFFACEAKFHNRSKHYLSQYGQVPQFKAGLHMGKVTAVEVGDIKRDIAYHGDTLNTAARIQSICNEYNTYFLASKYVLENSEVEKYYHTESLGMISLKGKKQAIEIASITGIKTT